MYFVGVHPCVFHKKMPSLPQVILDDHVCDIVMEMQILDQVVAETGGKSSCVVVSGSENQRASLVATDDPGYCNLWGEFSPDQIYKCQVLSDL